MKHLRVVFVIIICTLLLAACVLSDKEDQSQKSASGGASSAAKNINLKDISVTQDGENTVVKLSLLSGSRKTGYPESKLIQLPEYEITLLDWPQRLMIRLNNVSFWDYEQSDTWAFSKSVVGLFREVPADQDSLLLYLQLTQNATFTHEEQEGSLILNITPAEENEGIRYFCIANAFYAYQEGRWPLFMQPVLCSDLKSRLMISAPFDTREEAEQFVQSMSKKHQRYVAEKPLSVIALGSRDLPEYPADVDYAFLEKRQVIKNGATALLLENGKFLASSEDGRIAFSRSYKPEEPSLEQDSYLLAEQLFIRYPNGRIQNIEVPEFFSVDKASFSADGRYIGMLDVSIENRVLYVFDFESKKLYNLGEEGFGSQTASFAWSDIDNTIFAMTGFDKMQMMAGAFGEDGLEIFAVEEEAGSEGNIAVSSGDVFFADSIEEQVFKISDGRRLITKGIDLRVSPDGNTLLVLETALANSEQVLTNLKLCDIETGEETYIAQNEEIYHYGFASGGGKVYYTAASDENDDYFFGIYVFDMKNNVLKRVALSRTSLFAPSDDPGTLYLIDYINDSGSSGFYATYTYDLGT